MQLARPSYALDSRRFGRGPRRALAGAPVGRAVSNDWKLFATTFAAGLLFVSILIG